MTDVPVKSKSAKEASAETAITESTPGSSPKKGKSNGEGKAGKGHGKRAKRPVRPYSPSIATSHAESEDDVRIKREDVVDAMALDDIGDHGAENANGVSLVAENRDCLLYKFCLSRLQHFFPS